jgi:hypothetical protein
MGVSDLQHLCVDASALETTASSDAACVDKKGEEGRVIGKIDEFEHSVSRSQPITTN